MDAQTRIRLTIGDLLCQVAALSAKVEELEEQLKEKADSNSEDSDSR